MNPLFRPLAHSLTTVALALAAFAAGPALAAKDFVFAVASTFTTTKLVRNSSGDSYTNGTCFNDGLQPSESRVQVTGSRQGSIEYLFGTVTPTLSSQAVTRFEGK